MSGVWLNRIVSSRKMEGAVGQSETRAQDALTDVLLSSSDATIRMNVASHAADRLRNDVFPHPGGPTRSTPFGGTNLAASNSSGRSMESSIASRSRVVSSSRHRYRHMTLGRSGRRTRHHWVPSLTKDADDCQ